MKNFLLFSVSHDEPLFVISKDCIAVIDDFVAAGVTVLAICVVFGGRFF